MIKTRRSADRGFFDHGWLKTWHSFSFAGYLDPRHMGFGPLRVINQDIVEPGQGFGTHPHQDMEIITYVLSGTLAHKDSTGRSGSITPGEVQMMSAGRGITHSEFNGSDQESVELLQIWIEPLNRGGEPGYDQKRFEDGELADTLRLIVSGDGAQGSLAIDQDAQIYASRLTEGRQVSLDLDAQRSAWLQLARGCVRVSDTELTAGDGAAIESLSTITIEALEDAELLLFDLPAAN